MFCDLTKSILDGTGLYRQQQQMQQQQQMMLQKQKQQQQQQQQNGQYGQNATRRRKKYASTKGPVGQVQQGGPKHQVAKAYGMKGGQDGAKGGASYRQVGQKRY